MTTPAITGTVSHGTLRPQDLVPAFARALEVLDPVAARPLAAEASAVTDYDSEDTADLLLLIEEAIDDALPEGWRFGAHEGDGSDFGVWRDDADE